MVVRGTSNPWTLSTVSCTTAALSFCPPSTASEHQVTSLTSGSYTTRVATAILAPLQQLVPGNPTS